MLSREIMNAIFRKDTLVDRVKISSTEGIL